MLLHEVCELKIAAEYAYGEHGSPPKVQHIYCSTISKHRFIESIKGTYVEKNFHRGSTFWD